MVVVYLLPPEVRSALADLLRTELLAACHDALSRGADPDRLAGELCSRSAKLRGGTSVRHG